MLPEAVSRCLLAHEFEPEDRSVPVREECGPGVQTTDEPSLTVAQCG
jgi:hypothetical protein